MKQWFKIAIDFKNDYVEDWILNPRQALMDGVTVNSLEYLQNTTSTAWGKKKKKKGSKSLVWATRTAPK